MFSYMVGAPNIGHTFQRKQDLQDIFDNVMLGHSYKIRNGVSHLGFGIFHLVFHYKMISQRL